MQLPKPNGNKIPYSRTIIFRTSYLEIGLDDNISGKQTDEIRQSEEVEDPSTDFQTFFFPQIVILVIKGDLKFLFNLNTDLFFFFFPSISFYLQYYSASLWSGGKWSCMIFMSAERKLNVHSVK